MGTSTGAPASLMVLALIFPALGCSGGLEAEGEPLGSSSEALTLTYQAEAAFDIDEGVVETIHAGYRGSGYLNIDNFNNTFAWYIINRPVAGTVTVTVRYANGGTTSRPIRVSTNGGAGVSIAGAPTGSWTTWVTASVNVPFIAGNNDLFLSSVSNDGMPNIDEFSLAQTYTKTFQAEAAFDLDEGVVETVNGGYTGSGYVNIDNASNSFAWYIVDSPAAVTVPVTVRYANGTTSNRPMRVSANGGAGVQIAGAPTGSWTTWTTATVNVPLALGANDLFLSSVVSAGMPNVDKFDITW
jgi:Carbohydrate binding module (family 6)